MELRRLLESCCRFFYDCPLLIDYLNTTRNYGTNHRIHNILPSKTRAIIIFETKPALLELERNGVGHGRTYLIFKTGSQEPRFGYLVTRYWESGDGLVRVCEAGFVEMDREQFIVSLEEKNITAAQIHSKLQKTIQQLDAQIKKANKKLLPID